MEGQEFNQQLEDMLRRKAAYNRKEAGYDDTPKKVANKDPNNRGKYAPRLASPNSRKGIIQEITDGDTYKVVFVDEPNKTYKVRQAEINTPETRKEWDANSFDEPGGQAATAYANKIMPVGSEVLVDFTGAKSGSRDVGYVYGGPKLTTAIDSVLSVDGYTNDKYYPQYESDKNADLRNFGPPGNVGANPNNPIRKEQETNINNRIVGGVDKMISYGKEQAPLNANEWVPKRKQSLRPMPIIETQKEVEPQKTPPKMFNAFNRKVSTSNVQQVESPIADFNENKAKQKVESKGITISPNQWIPTDQEQSKKPFPNVITKKQVNQGGLSSSVKPQPKIPVSQLDLYEQQMSFIEPKIVKTNSSRNKPTITNAPVGVKSKPIPIQFENDVMKDARENYNKLLDIRKKTDLVDKGVLGAEDLVHEYAQFNYDRLKKISDPKKSTKEQYAKLLEAKDILTILSGVKLLDKLQSDKYFKLHLDGNSDDVIRASVIVDIYNNAIKQ